MSILIPGPREELCLDYANTLAWRGRERPVEGLAAVADLLAWLSGNAGWPPAEFAARAAPPDDLFDAALALRETIWRLFSALAEGRAVADGDLLALAEAVAGAPARRHLARLDAGFGWQVAEQGRLSAPLLLAPVLWSAADLLLAAPRHQRVRRCANDECLWLFLDRSKSGSRRWCDMAACGNRAKARRHYLKVTGAAAPAARDDATRGDGIDPAPA